MAQCVICGTEVVQGRGRARRTCSAACRQKAHRARQAGQLAELRAAAAKPALTLVPPTPPAVPTPDSSPAGRIRAAGATLADAIEQAARRAEEGWTAPGLAPEVLAGRTGSVQYFFDKVLAAIVASVPEVSRNEPESDAAPTDTATPSTGSSRHEPPVDVVTAPVAPEVPTADSEPSRNDPPVKPAPAQRKRLTQKAARATADRSRLVRDKRHEGWLLRDDETGTVLGHIEPSYGGTSVSGRNGWTYRVDGSFSRTGPYKTRDKAAVQCALSWIRLATAPVRSTITGD